MPEMTDADPLAELFPEGATEERYAVTPEGWLRCGTLNHLRNNVFRTQDAEAVETEFHEMYGDDPELSEYEEFARGRAADFGDGPVLTKYRSAGKGGVGLTEDILTFRWLDEPTEAEYVFVFVHHGGDYRLNYEGASLFEINEASNLAPGRVDFWCSDCEIGHKWDGYFGWETGKLSSDSFDIVNNVVSCHKCGEEVSVRFD